MTSRPTYSGSWKLHGYSEFYAVLGVQGRAPGLRRGDVGWIDRGKQVH